MAEISQNASASQAQKIAQTQVLSPQMLRRLEILRRPTDELDREVEEECAKNPLLEIVAERKDFFEHERLLTPEEAAAERARSERRHAESEWGGGGDINATRDSDKKEFYRDSDELFSPARKWTSDDEKRREFIFDTAVQKESLYDVLERQIGETDAPAATKKILEKICANLTEKGFFDRDIESFAEEEGVSVAAATAALKLFQSFDPPGIGARDYRESYMIQLRRRGREKSLAFRIVDKAYALFTKAKFAEIADEFDVSDAAVREAIAELAALKILPAAGFLEDTNRVVVPEIIFRESAAGGWEVDVATRYCCPKVQVSSEWKKRVLLGDVPGKDKKYFDEKIKSAEEFVANLKNRESTLARLGEEILKSQREFFEKGFAGLQPMTQNDVAARIGVDPSTISRAVNGKFAQTPWGTIELKRFFSTGIQGLTDNVSNAAIREMIKEIIENEPRDKPLSDDKISKELAARGITAARRTVMKYREALRIPSTYKRRRV
ncbi:MAG: RNA polymerase factor sigma-54 [Opitutae bacterium]|nr:RNA polymerase factor sigma-54 [Opitutae bacterium]